jgi:hypothetical protein
MPWRGHTITPPTDNRNLPVYKVRPVYTYLEASKAQWSSL